MAQQPRLRQVGAQVAQRVLRPHLRVAVGAHHAQRGGRGWVGLHDAEQQVEGVRSRPLQVVEQQQCPRRPGQIGQTAGHGGEEQPPLLLGRHGGQGLRQGDELGQQAPQPGATHQGGAQAGGRQGVQVLGQGVEEWAVGLLTVAAMAAAAQHGPALGNRLLGGGLQEARLADARLPRQQQHRHSRPGGGAGICRPCQERVQ